MDNKLKLLFCVYAKKIVKRVLQIFMILDVLKHQTLNFSYIIFFNSYYYYYYYKWQNRVPFHHPVIRLNYDRQSVFDVF